MRYYGRGIPAFGTCTIGGVPGGVAVAHTVLIIGDSISGYYLPHVQALLPGDTFTINHRFGGCSAQVLACLPECVPGAELSLVQFNSGLHDARFFRSSQAYQQPIGNYAAHLRGIIRWLRSHTNARLLWVSTTPVITERIKAEYVRYERDIEAYNAVAARIMEEAGIPVADLYGAVMADSVADCLSEDGVHMTERGNLILARAVADGIRAQFSSP